MRMATAGSTPVIRGGAEAISQHARPLRATRGQREASAGRSRMACPVVVGRADGRSWVADDRSVP
jgi:hypothetical protein